MENKLRIAAAIAAQTGLEADQLKDWLETPPDPAMGDYAFPCFRLAKTMRKAPPAIAAELAGSIGHIDGIASMEAKGGYLNFFADKTAFVRDTLNKVLAQGDSYGDSDLGGGRNVCVEYSSINIAKPFHIGHLPSTAIGNSLYRIYKALGYNAIGINHLGDWGTQFGKMIVAYKKWGDKPRPAPGSKRSKAATRRPLPSGSSSRTLPSRRSARYTTGWGYASTATRAKASMRTRWAQS